MVEYNLLPDEEMLIEGSPSLLQAFLDNLALSVITFGIAAWLIANNSGLAVTDQRIIIKEGGLLGATTHEVRLDNVQGASQDGRHLTVSNAAGESYFLSVENPGDIRNAVNRAQNQ